MQFISHLDVAIFATIHRVQKCPGDWQGQPSKMLIRKTEQKLEPGLTVARHHRHYTMLT